MAKYEVDDHFRRFATTLERAIAGYGETVDLYQRQKAQVEGLVGLERDLRLALTKHPWGRSVYREFVRYICDEKPSILDARPYYREPMDVFSGPITSAFKARDHEALYAFAFNFRFVAFVDTARQWKSRCGAKIAKLIEQIKTLRQEIVVMNLPLALSHARRFYTFASKRGHLAHMDLAQIAAGGLMSAVDKFQLPFRRVFRSVILGRAGGDLIQGLSETMIHYGPDDKKKLYRANSVTSRKVGPIDFEEVATQVNKLAVNPETGKVSKAQLTTPAEIAEIMAGASLVSLTVGVSGDDEVELPGQWDRAPDDCRPDVQAESRDTMRRFSEAVAKLSVFERKLLVLRGVEV